MQTQSIQNKSHFSKLMSANGWIYLICSVARKLVNFIFIWCFSQPPACKFLGLHPFITRPQTALSLQSTGHMCSSILSHKMQCALSRNKHIATCDRPPFVCKHFKYKATYLRPQELQGLTSLRTKVTCRLHVRLDDDQTVIVEIRNDQPAVFRESNSSGRVEMLPHCAWTSTGR